MTAVDSDKYRYYDTKYIGFVVLPGLAKRNNKNYLETKEIEVKEYYNISYIYYIFKVTKILE